MRELIFAVFVGLGPNRKIKFPQNFSNAKNKGRIIHRMARLLSLNPFLPSEKFAKLSSLKKSQNCEPQKLVPNSKLPNILLDTPQKRKSSKTFEKKSLKYVKIWPFSTQILNSKPEFQPNTPFIISNFFENTHLPLYQTLTAGQFSKYFWKCLLML